MSWVSANGSRVHFELKGEAHGPVIMLAHSLASDMSMWRPQVSALTEAGYRVLCYNTRGHGESEATEDPYTLELLADDAVGLMDALDLERVVFCGCSIGGMVGQLLGATRRERLLALILAATSSHMPPRSMWDERISIVREQGMAALADAAIDRWFTPDFLVSLNPIVGELREALLTTRIEGFCGCAAAIRDMDLRELILSIRLPTLVLVGESDAGTPVESAQSIHDAINGSELEIFPNSAHFANIEQAESFNRVMLDFLVRNVQFDEQH